MVLTGDVPPGGALRADEWLTELAASLRVDPPPDVRVHVGPGPSGVVGRYVAIADRSDGALGRAGWFELLLKHELVHLLIEAGWGRGPALLWEGLPIALADLPVRARFGVSYVEHCRALAAAGRLVPLEELVLASSYYPRRADPTCRPARSAPGCWIAAGRSRCGSCSGRGPRRPRSARWRT